MSSSGSTEPELSWFRFGGSLSVGGATGNHSAAIQSDDKWLVAESGLLKKSGVSVEKVPQLMLVAVQCSGYKQARVLDAVVHHSIWRPAAHDGTPFPRGVAVLLLPARRSGS